MDLKGLFDSGIDFEEYYRTSQDRYRNYADHALARFADLANHVPKADRITGSYEILAIGENWCIDSIMNIPAAHWLETVNGQVRLRILPVDRYPASQRDAAMKTPTLIILDKDHREVARWIQYPRPIAEAVRSGDQVRIITEKKRYRRGEYLAETLNEILDLLLEVESRS